MSKQRLLMFVYVCLRHICLRVSVYETAFFVCLTSVWELSPAPSTGPPQIPSKCSSFVSLSCLSYEGLSTPICQSSHFYFWFWHVSVFIRLPLCRSVITWRYGTILMLEHLHREFKGNTRIVGNLVFSRFVASRTSENASLTSRTGIVCYNVPHNKRGLHDLCHYGSGA